MNKPFQRIGSRSNAQAGRDFELAAQRFLESIGLSLDRNVRIPVGIGAITKDHAFDLGSLSRKVIVECKCHRWTTSDNIPSAKLTVWNQAMYYFVAAPRDYRRILLVLRDYSRKRDETLAEYYLRTYRHLIPSDVELWEYDEESRSARRLAPDANLSPTHTKGKPMNKQIEVERDPDMLDDYDFSQGVRGKSTALCECWLKSRGRVPAKRPFIEKRRPTWRQLDAAGACVIGDPHVLNHEKGKISQSSISTDQGYRTLMDLSCDSDG